MSTYLLADMKECLGSVKLRFGKVVQQTGSRFVATIDYGQGNRLTHDVFEDDNPRVMSEDVVLRMFASALESLSEIERILTIEGADTKGQALKIASLFNTQVRAINNEIH